MTLSQLRLEASLRLQKDQRGFSKLVLINVVITAGISLLLMLVSWLSQYIAPEGGLSNMGTQTMLATLRTLLQLASIMIVPFWDAGLIFCSLQLLRGKSSTPATLLEGFHRWGPLASSLLIRGLIYFLSCMACSFASSLLLSFLPIPPTILDELIAFTEAPTLPLTGGVRSFFIVFFVVFCINLCILLVPKLYLHRQIVYRIMDDEPCTGAQAVLHSGILMKGNRRKLFLLDLSFWWFYLLELCISLFSMGNLLLAELGIVIPISAEATIWVFPVISLLARVVLYWFAKPKLAVTYALFYQQVFDQSLSEPEPPQTKRKPWKY